MEKSNSSRKARKEKLTAEFAKKAQRTQREKQISNQHSGVPKKNGLLSL